MSTGGEIAFWGGIWGDALGTILSCTFVVYYFFSLYFSLYFWRHLAASLTYCQKHESLSLTDACARLPMIFFGSAMFFPALGGIAHVLEKISNFNIAIKFDSAHAYLPIIFFGSMCSIYARSGRRVWFRPKLVSVSCLHTHNRYMCSHQRLQFCCLRGAWWGECNMASKNLHSSVTKKCSKTSKNHLDFWRFLAVFISILFLADREQCQWKSSEKNNQAKRWLGVSWQTDTYCT